MSFTFGILKSFILSVPSQIYEFKTIKEMEEFQMEGDRARKVVDFIGIIKSADTEVNTIMIRSQNKEVSKVSTS